MLKGYIISITNHKGGVGKTTTACNLAHALTRLGKKVLVVDMDLQCNSTSTLFGEDRPRYSLYNLLSPVNKINIEQCITGTALENLYVIPNIRETAAIERDLIKEPNLKGLSLFRDRFREYAINNFDFTLIDCPPNLGTFVLSALMASTFVIVPSEAGSKYSLEGLNEAVSFIEDLRGSVNADLKFLRVLLTKVDLRMLVHKAAITQIRNFYPSEKVFKTLIPTNTALQQAEMAAKTIFTYRSNASGAIAYAKLSKELLTFFKTRDY